MPLTREEIIVLLVSAYGYLEFCDLDEGICHNCGHIQSDVEPDARCYPCEECKNDTVFGVAETLMTML